MATIFMVAFFAVVGSAQADRDSIGGLSLQPDGNIVAVGSANKTWTPHTSEFGVARYTPAGTLDASFANEGKLTENFGANAEANAVARQADGKLVVVGTYWDGSDPLGATEGLAVLRLDSTGALDPSFSGDGKFAQTVGTFAQATSVAIDSAGAIVLGGANGSGSGLLVRLTPFGTLDTTFSGDGELLLPTGSIGGVALQGDGKIVVAGRANIESFYVARLNPDGTPDTSFSGDGETTEPLAAYGGAEAVAIQPDGKIVTVGSTGDAYTNDYTVVRYNSDGTLDSTFSGDGVATQNVYVFDVANSVAIQPDGSILVAGEEFGSFAVVRFLSTGVLDTAFGQGGLLTDHEEADGRAIALDADGSFLVGGTTTCCDESSRFLLSRYNSLGAKVSAFGNGGDILTDFDGDPPVDQTPPPLGGTSQTPTGVVTVTRPSAHVALPKRCRKGYVKKTTKGKSRCAKKHKKKRTHRTSR
jgi:uncharacterized delta-60 repeat protein